MKNRIIVRSFMFAIVLLSSVAALAQDTPLTLENIYNKGAFRQKGFGPVRWMKDSRGYSTVESNEINQYDAQTGAKTVLVSAKQLTPAGGTAPLEIEDYTWSEDN